MSPRNRVLALALLLVLAAPDLGAAPPNVPAKLSYQGVLLDDLGNPLTGPVDLTVRLYDGIGGGATLLYLQNYLAVPLVEGVFSIIIGPAGSTSESPLTTSLADVFSGDLVAAPARWVELTADGDTAQARIQILSAPLALRAESAESADTAISATTATSVTTINGLDPSALNQIFQYADFDGGDPPNDDPSEGLADADGDGIANFLESDNDADGLSDVLELAEASDINLVTPKISGASPTIADFGFPVVVTISGSNFEAGQSVSFGSESPAPANLSSTSFDVTVGPQASGFPTIQVTRANGESDAETGLFEFSEFTPTVTSVVPNSVPASQSIQVTVNGSNFEPGITVAFGAENPVPSNVTQTSFDVTVGPQPTSIVDVTVTRLSGASGTGVGAFTFLPLSQSGLPHNTPGPHTSFDVFGSASVIGEWMDTDGDDVWEREVLIDPASLVKGKIDLGFDANGRLVGLLALSLNSVCNVRYRQDDDSNNRLFDGESVAVESFGVPPDCGLDSASVASLSAGAGVIGYTRQDASLRDVILGVDRNGDDDFADPNELLTLASGVDSGEIEVMADGSDRIAAIVTTTTGGASETRLFHDRTGDGDFADADEDVLLFADAGACIGVASDGPGIVAVYQDPANLTGPTVLQDLNADGDYADADEQQTITVGPTLGCAVAHTTVGTAAIFRTSLSSVWLYVDRDGDGLFAGVDEILTLGLAAAGEVNVHALPDGTVHALTEDVIFESLP